MRVNNVLIGLLLLNSLNGIAQKNIFSKFNKSAITLQYAGSIGFVSIGFSAVTKKNKLELGLLYGKVPRLFGGVHRTLNLKGTYNPFQVKLGGKIISEPLQAGAILSQNFGETLGLNWGDKYPPGYYWWPKSLRTHLFVSTQFSVMLNKKYVDRISLYLETNTNDLYLYSYLPNTKTMSLYDILFFGAGLKCYLKKPEKTE
jgi:hypothetical protein